MRKIFVFLCVCSLVLQLQAQSAALPAGEYLLTGEQEMAAGFKLDSNGRFQFFFSYGALDRQGSGTWKVEGNRLLLNSESKDVQDFQLTAAKRSTNKQLQIFISGVPLQMMNYISATAVLKGKKASGTANQKGWIVLPFATADSLLLQFLWCPEKSTRLAVIRPQNNQFSFRVLPSVTDVVFDNFALQIADGELAGTLPFSGDHICHFQRRTSDDQRP